MGHAIHPQYLVGQDAGVVVRWRASNVRNELLHTQRSKTGRRVRIELVGALQTLLERLTVGTVGDVWLFRHPDGTPFTLRAMQKRFAAARSLVQQHWQLRDLRAKAATDLDDPGAASLLLAHAQRSTTDIYLRERAGVKATPLMTTPAERRKL